jgi:hypothetical protein
MRPRTSYLQNAGIESTRGYLPLSETQQRSSSERIISITSPLRRTLRTEARLGSLKVFRSLTQVYMETPNGLVSSFMAKASCCIR